MAILTAITGITSLVGLVTGKPQQVSYAIRDKITEVEKLIGKGLPKAWAHWKEYVSYTDWGNQMFFVWDKQVKWDKAKEHVEKIQKILEAEVKKFEATKVALKKDWKKYLPLVIGGGIGIMLIILVARRKK